MSTYYIASLKHTNSAHEHITFWGRFHRGYTQVIGDRAGLYCYGEACTMNNGREYIAVPADVVKRLLSPEPYFMSRRGTTRFYDQRGPVVDNTAASWATLIRGRLLPEGEQFKPKPEVFKGQKRTYANAGVAV